LPRGEVLSAFDASAHHVGINQYDIVNQRFVSHHYWFDGDSVEQFSSTHRFAWPAEYDLMANIAGMRLHARWAGWQREAFTDMSSKHVSVWQK